MVWLPFGLAVALRAVGAVLMASVAVTVVAAAQASDPVVQLRELVPVGAGPAEAAGRYLPTRAGERARNDFVWRPFCESIYVPIGIVAVLVSFLFDGHTVTEGQRISTGILDIVHVAAGAVWAGGLVLLAMTIWRRHRRNDDTHALRLAVRFSVLAALALVAAGVAGSILTIIILDSPSDLWTTTWGRVLIAKTLLVGVTGSLGLYNHRVLIPQMAATEAGVGDAELKFRRAVTLEGLCVLTVIVATAFLVASSSV